MRLRTFVAVVAVIVLGTAGVAHAKGPTEATITGDSLSTPIALSGAEGGDTDYWHFVEQAGFFESIYGQEPDHTTAAAPTADLGPEFVVAWRLPSEAGADTIVSTVYPYAAGGPLTYTAPGQPFFGTERTQGGWLRASAQLPATLVDLGVPAPPGFAPTTIATVPAPTFTAPPALATPPRATAPTPTAATAAPGSTWWPALGIAAGVLAAAAFAVGVGLAARARRRIHVSPA